MLDVTLSSAAARPHTVRAPRLAAVALLFLALAALAPRAAHAQTEPQRLHSGTLSVIDGQYARLNVYFTRSADGELPPGPCRVTLRFLDTRGQIVAESVQTLVPNRDTVLDYRPTGLRPGQRATVRAVLIGERDSNRQAPALVPSLEVVDAASGRSTIVAPGTIRGFNPQPEPPGDRGTFGLASQQVGRLHATYVGLPSDSGLPPGPCNVLLTIVNGNGSILVRRELTLAPGETASIDYAAGVMVPGVRRRMWATISTDGREQGFVTGAVEVFDEPTGMSTALFPSDFVLSWGWE